MIRLTVILGLLVFFRPVLAQDSIENALLSFEDIVLEIASDMEQETDLDDLTDRLNEIIENPIKINFETNEYHKLFWLHDLQIQNLRKYILDNGPLVSVYEIQYIEGFTARDAKLMIPFISLEMWERKITFSPAEVFRKGEHRLLLRSHKVLEKQKGYQGNYEGGPTSIYARYSFKWDSKLFLGFTGENDPGEALFKGSNRNGFDYQSFFVQVNPGRIVQSIFLGDYRVSFGQGLNIWSGYNLGKSVTMNSFGKGTGITRYASTDENRFFRGAAVVINLKPLEVSIWFSSHRVDGNIISQDSVPDRARQVSSLQTTGIHALNSEIKDEDAVNARVMGINISFIKNRYILGLTANYYTYSAFINPEMEDYNRYYFRGKSNYNLSLESRLRIGRKTFLFGEDAVSQNGGFAMIHGFETYISPETKWRLAFRHYGRIYQTMYGNAFGNNSLVANESGLYTGLECKLVKNFIFSGYMEVFHFPWLSYQADLPSSGRDFMGQLSFNHDETWQLELQYRNKLKEMNNPEGFSLTKGLEKVITNKVRFRCRYLVSDAVHISTGMEWSGYCPEWAPASRGFLICEDVEYTFRKVPLKTTFRYSLFDTDDYNSRIYLYENDLLYTFSVPAFYDEGYRTYFLCKYSPSKSLDFWIKIALLEFASKEQNGSSTNEINGSRRTDMRIQMMLKF